MNKQIAYLPGDGIGPEVAAEARKVLQTVADTFGHEFEFVEAPIGAMAIEATGSAFPDVTRELCENADAILFGAIGELKYDNDPKAKVRPEQGLLAMREHLGLYANIRPIITFPTTAEHSPLKAEIVDGVDFVVVRELINGIYFGERGRSEAGDAAFDTSNYTKEAIEQVAKIAFELAQKRHRKLTVVDKANVLETSRLWRETVQAMEDDYRKVSVEYLFVDNAAMKIIQSPSDFDVIVTENMFGDILTDEASVITGSLGMLPSASIGGSVGLYEPIHGSYPQAAGKNIANPIGSILSAAMLLNYSFDLQKEHDAVFKAVQQALDHGAGTEDLVSNNPLSTTEMGAAIRHLIKK